MAIAAVGQICSTTDISANLAQCRRLVHRAAVAGAKALFLPEASDFIACSPKQTVGLAQSLGESEFVVGLQREAQQAGLHINVGIHEPTTGERVKNSSIWIDDKGVITQRYHKVHLFDATTPGESTTVEKGKGILPVFETPVGRVGLLICFDLRFPEISLALRRQDAQIISYASAFLAHTGPAHWETLLRARAIETQCYVIAAAQAGPHNKERTSYGHSMIVNPWGEVVAKLGDEHKEPQIATAEIDFDFFSRVRRKMKLPRGVDSYQ
ncbi:nitrilase family protein [Aspergillus udagawae]|uniref:Nitrilase family protein, partial n=1 Tax=Aspergillus udagawae TaxID=91492 RepID=A0ABQ1ASC4_9EURO|nr:nitrilase family protein [Aspergillus udagawae]GFF87153.1 nitrilase family protein [Aspergillus udagawae]GFG13202.1 nitrilase family protein [Aspergillus udagawae]